LDTERVIVPTKITRSGLAIRAVLAELAPDECAQFEAETLPVRALVTTKTGSVRVGLSPHP